MKRITFAFLLALALTIVSPHAVEAGSGITIISSDAEALFPTSIEFSLEAEAASDIVSVELEYRVEWHSIVPVDCRVRPDFTVGKHVDVLWAWEMLETGGLPTGTVLEYRWRIEDEHGNELSTETSTINFDDLRYNWKSINHEQMTFFWYEGDETFIQDLIAAANDALENLWNEFNCALGQPAKLYIYANAMDMQGALIYPDEWTGGMAFPDYNTIVIGISTSNLAWGQRAIAHELGHMVVHQMVSGPFGVLPTWLDEGLAMTAEGELRQDLQSALAQAIDRDAMFSVRSITGSFPANTDQAELCYAESYSVVQFLSEIYGSQKLLDLLGVFAQGSTSDEALLAVYGFDTEELNRRWRISLGLSPEQPGYPADESGEGGLAVPYIVLLVQVVILGVLVILLSYRYFRRVR